MENEIHRMKEERRKKEFVIKCANNKHSNKTTQNTRVLGILADENRFVEHR